MYVFPQSNTTFMDVSASREKGVGSHETLVLADSLLNAPRRLW
ncbi:hypothetical protein LX87_04660 [Larkinella arboricola]|uniref:Uncharacterized protein n=1 Tax=Larkinella arboricola TaxID=643671 RepID=A0A327WPK1_LARAB|nr:hypothetical protein LX87_04660 [Larkinella arboricola]